MGQYRVLTSTKIEYTSAAAETRSFNATGRCYYLTQGTDVLITVVDDQNRKLMDQFSLSVGRGVKFPENSELLGYRVFIKSATAQTISLDVLDGEILDNSVIIANTNAITVVPGAAGSWTDVAGTSAAAGASTAMANLGADGTRIRAIVGNPISAANAIYLRFNNTAAISPVAIQPGNFVEVEGIQAVYIYNPGASAITPLLQRFA